MSDEAAFVRAIVANPSEEVLRLAFADWLEEHGMDASARLLRQAGYWRAYCRWLSYRATESGLMTADWRIGDSGPSCRACGWKTGTGYRYLIGIGNEWYCAAPCLLLQQFAPAHYPEAHLTEGRVHAE